MRLSMSLVIPLVGFMFVAGASAHVGQHVRFTIWYPKYGVLFEDTLNSNCTAEHDHFVNNDHIGNAIPLVNCMLGHTSEYIKSAMAGAQVLLGLTPSILALIGPGADDFAMLAAIGGRPILAALLSLAVPAVFVSRGFENRHPREAIGLRYHDPFELTPRDRWQRCAIVAVEYLAVAAALANVGSLSWSLGVRAVCTVGTSFTWLYILWVVLAFPIYVGAVVLFHLRATRKWEQEDVHGLKGCKGFLQRELGLQGHLQTKIFVEFSKGSGWYVLGLWTHSVCLIVHLVYGTMVFSATLFVAPEDALGIFCRFGASVLVGRFVLMYELDLLKDGYRRSGEIRSVGVSPQEDPNVSVRPTNEAEVELQTIENHGKQVNGADTQS